MNFVPRLNDNGITTSPYFFSDYNPYYETVISGARPYQMPNCTTYAWGRVAESGGLDYNDYSTRPTLSTGNAEDWYNYPDGYQRSQTPQLGAVLCFADGSASGDGHVCVVEEIYQDGSILVSESGYNAYFWRLTTRYPGGAYPYSNGAEQYIFQGFILNPYVQGGAPPEPLNWITGNRQLSRAEMDQNAIKFYYRASALGAHYNAILGMLANIEDESWINPGVWESFIPYAGGYGLVQWTPYTKYSSWAGSGWEDNGDKEVEFLKYTVDNQDIPQYIQWFANNEAPTYGYPVQPPITLAQFWESNLDPKVLADYWILYYEHPREDLIAGRIAGHQAKVDYYNQLLNGGTPVPTGGRFKWWLAHKHLQRKRGLI